MRKAAIINSSDSGWAEVVKAHLVIAIKGVAAFFDQKIPQLAVFFVHFGGVPIIEILNIIMKWC